MICEQAMELMSAELDGVLSEEERQTLEAHLDRCEDCRRLHAAMASIDEQVAALEVPAPEGLKQGVMYRIEQESGKKKGTKRRFFGGGTGVGIAAAVLVLLVGSGVIRLPALSGASVPVAAEPHGGTKNNLTTSAYAYFEPNENAPDGEHAEQNGAEPSKGILPPDKLSPTPAGTAAPGVEDAEPDRDSRGNPITRQTSEQLRTLCGDLSKQTGAPVLLYTDFTCDSLLAVLKQYAPELAERLEDCAVVERDGLVRFETDWQTVLAVQEWLLAVKPGTDADASELAGRMLEQMEALDPDSEYLYRVVTFRDREPEPLPLSAWPKTWPELWAERLLRQENWALFLPSEESSPRAADTAWLVFPDDR